MTKKNNYAGGLSNYIVLKEEKEVIFYLHNPYPDCLEIPDIMKQRFPSDYKSIVVNSLDEFKKYGGKVWALNGITILGRKNSLRVLYKISFKMLII